jgi:hypothetical protein
MLFKLLRIDLERFSAMRAIERDLAAPFYYNGFKAALRID